MTVSTNQPNDRAWVEVDLDNLVENARAVHRAAHDAALLPMIKANGYGLGVHAVVRALEAVDPWGFGVATVDEGRELREFGIERPIVVFTPANATQLGALLEYDLRPVLDAPAVIRQWPSDRPYHCEIDTGMSRAGVRWDDATALAVVAASAPEGVFTHFHSPDEDGDTVSLQLERLRAALNALGDRPRLVHVCNSAGTWRVDDHFDLVRPGIFLYGGEIGNALPRPSPVVSVRARVMSLRRVPAGESVSYGAEWTADQETTVATLGIGYADGLPRAVQGHAAVLVRGRRFPLVGRVTMDMSMVNLGPSGSDEFVVGDVATVIGADGEGRITLDEFAAGAGTISYEILVGLGSRLPRHYSPS